MPQKNLFETGWWDNELFNGCDRDLLTKFRQFHEKNPHIYEIMERFALEAGRRRKRFSIWMIANRVRWYTDIETTGRTFKVSNDYLALYARLLVIRNKHLDGLFTFKAFKRNRTTLPQE